MAFFASESPAPDMEKAIRMIERGQELMIQLRCLLLLQLPAQECLPDPCWVLMDDISGTLGLSLLALRSWEQPMEPRDAAAQRNRSLFPEDDLKSKGSSRKRKSELIMAKGEDDRKKRKREYSSTTMTAAPYDDGYQWRKYGQKVIRGAKYPRSYFRCTYCNELDCPAIKQVQQTDNDDPPMFLTIYTHKHTCNSGQSAPHVIVESTPAEKFSLSFVSRCTATPQQHPLPTELGDQQESCNETWTTLSGAALFSASELTSMSPVGQFLMNTPDDAQAQPSTVQPSEAPPPSPQIWEIEGLLDSLLGNS
ncbi:hypothetical protein Taro_035160 [Colocasia esculenta]|uniref:WRKY domain-containing protein n=1 Tax=Colocasia esculenta TaxID=4460 RepID=A0A843W2Z1_COLES|nr:hypothetical protein [Colocasia esculenta]